ncbi:Uncharacterised protein [Vibrio cholerae]|nr:Uncharacterised protein [Vibrio cholerae]CSD35308.1 Uncharacterised protein [Vibrio cholerae]
MKFRVQALFFRTDGAHVKHSVTEHNRELTPQYLSVIAQRIHQAVDGFIHGADGGVIKTLKLQLNHVHLNSPLVQAVLKTSQDRQSILHAALSLISRGSHYHSGYTLKPLPFHPRLWR